MVGELVIEGTSKSCATARMEALTWVLVATAGLLAIRLGGETGDAGHAAADKIDNVRLHYPGSARLLPTP